MDSKGDKVSSTDKQALKSQGFSETGPVAKTPASDWQSNIGNVDKGSKFSDCQQRAMKPNK